MNQTPDSTSAIHLDLQVLGPLRILVDGRAAELGPARRRTLLAALAVDPGRIVSLDTLADRIWDGHPPANPSATIHAYVSRLRSSTSGSDASGHALPSLLKTRAPGYLLALPADGIDAHRFSRGVDEARAALDRQDLLDADVLVRRALALWRDDAYLDIAADFARREAARLADLRLDARELKARVDIALGRHETLVAELPGLLETAPLREGLHAVLALAYYRSGRQADALRHLEDVRTLIADELGLDPGPGLRRLQEQILRQDPSLDAPETAASADTQPNPSVSAGTSHPGPTGAGTATNPGDDPGHRAGPAGVDAAVSGTRLVGRQVELDRIDALLRHSGTGQVTPVALVGEAGIGKSRLAEELAARAQARDVVVAWGRCWQHEGAPVLWPWLQALEALTDRVPHEVLRASLTGRAGEVVALLPGLAALVEAPPPAAGPPPGPSQQVRLYDAVTRFLVQLAQRVPILLVLEDMHWADLASREVTEYLVGNARDAGLAVVLTVRSATDDASRAGTELLTAMARSGRATRVDLAGLDRDAVGALVADRTGSALDEATAEALLDRTGGNPFFVGELVRLLVTDVEGSDGDAPPVSTAVPDSIREVITRRISRLAESDQTVLRVAAVVGRSFDLDLIEAVAGADADAVDEAVDRATAIGIVSSEPDDPGRHRFVHALTQQALLETTGPAKVRRFHGRLAETLLSAAPADDPSPAHAEQVVFHLSRAGSQDQLETATDLCTRAAETATRQGNHPEAEALLLRAVDLSGRLTGERAGPLELAARIRLWLHYTVVNGPGTPQALGQHERTLELIGRHGGAREIMAGHQAVFSRLIWADALDGVEMLTDEMAAAAEAADDDLMRVANHLARGETAVHRGRLRLGLDHLRMGRELIASLPATPPGTFPLTPESALPLWELIARTALDDPAAGTVHDDLDREVVGAAEITVAYVETMLGFVDALRDDPAGARAHCDRARGLMLTHGLLDGMVFLAPVRAWALERCDPGTALEELLDALTSTEVLPTMALRPSLFGLAADVLLRAGRAQEARTLVQRALDETDASGDRFSLVELHRLLALTRVALGEPEATVSDALDRGRRLAAEQDAQLFLTRLEMTAASL